MKKYDSLLAFGRDEYSRSVDLAKVTVSNDLAKLMRDEGISRSRLADRMGSSAAYITKILSGDFNFQMKTLAKLAVALKARLVIRLIKPGERIEIVEKTKPSAAEASRDATLETGAGLAFPFQRAVPASNVYSSATSSSQSASVQ